MDLKRFVLLFLPILIIGYGMFFEDINTALDELLKDPCEYPLDGNTYSIAVSPTGHVWAVTDNALLEYDGETWQSHLEPAIHFNDLPFLIIEFDPQGWLWLGGDEGIMIYDGKDWTFYEPEDWGLPGTMVTSFAFAPDGRAWVGLSRSRSSQDDPGGGIGIFDGETWTTFHTRFANTATYDDISAIQFDPQGRPWIGTSTGTVSVIEEIISFSVGGGGLPAYHLPEENVISSAVDEDGAIHYTAFSAQTYSQNSTPQIPIKGEVYSIDFDDQGDTWVYIYKNLYRFDGKRFKLMQTTEWDSMGNVTIDPQGNVWFGLKVYDGHRWQTYNEKNSCISSTVYNIAFDHSGTAWVAHTYDYDRKIGVTTFEDRPYRIPIIFLGLRTLLVPKDPVFRWIIPIVLAGVWLFIFLKLDWPPSPG
jgi:ligand-binding sensor domain-containing protein